jgi:sporulation protein YlmC with PRC-barrel domain
VYVRPAGVSPRGNGNVALRNPTLMAERADVSEWQDRPVSDLTGKRIGKISGVYADPATGKLEWAAVSSGWLGRCRFVPLAGALADGDGVRVRVTRGQIKRAPRIEADGALSEQQEDALFGHYRIPAPPASSSRAD